MAIAVVKDEAEIQVSVAWAGAHWRGEIALRLPTGATIEQAIIASKIAANMPHGELAAAVCGVWGKVRSRQHVLRDGDRVELYRPLQADPKDARRAKVSAGKRAPERD